MAKVMSMKEEALWFVIRNGIQCGPFTQEQLRDLLRYGQLSPLDAVWTRGMRDCVPLSRVPELLSFYHGPDTAVPVIPKVGLPVVPTTSSCYATFSEAADVRQNVRWQEIKHLASVHRNFVRWFYSMTVGLLALIVSLGVLMAEGWLLMVIVIASCIFYVVLLWFTLELMQSLGVNIVLSALIAVVGLPMFSLCTYASCGAPLGQIVGLLPFVFINRLAVRRLRAAGLQVKFWGVSSIPG
ncbi:MAG: DUF4339 domain-containing protein [Gemmatales bacterium]|nr:DUF4339 domain-containing protein [Gemmatales bacterium]